MSNNEVKSPCIAICRVKQGICIGCFRTTKEITEWWDADPIRKQEIVETAQQRKNDFEAA